MEKRSRLGRGLSSLLNSPVEDSETPTLAPPDVARDRPAPAQAPAAPREMFHVELSRVVPNPHQPRKHFDETALQALAQSVVAAGIIQPIIVRAVDDHFEVIAGERRWRAAQIAGLETIPVFLRSVDAFQQSRMALIENIHRENLNPIERALAYRKLIQEGNLTHQVLATQLGEDRSSITNHLRLLDLQESVRALLVSGELSLGHAKLLAGVEEPVEQMRLAELVVNSELSVRDLEKTLKVTPEGEKILTKPLNAHIADLERQLSRDLQMRAEVRQATKGGKGRLIIHYASLDQFDILLNRLGVKIED